MMKNAEAFEAYQKRLNRVGDHIAAHLDDSLDYARLAEIACLSPWHWHRIYRAVYGETIHATVTRLRLHRAAGQLLQTDDRLEDIARHAGYSSVAAFTRSFKSAYGMAPSGYRADGRHAIFDKPFTEENDAMYDVEIRDFPERLVAGVPHRGSYMEVDKAFGDAVGKMAAAGALRPEMAMIGIYYSDPGLTEEKNLKSFAGLVVPEGFALPDELELRHLPGGRYAVLRHKGPYAELHKAYRWFYGSYLPENRYEPADAPPSEVYLNNPREVSPRDLLTEICIPINR
ncbi:AraC family transcriptional regulator [Martelella limonii]|uniref:AraC family transcriptional regulator n=1 Tax=Martelella limonii TaxID=1647649 RepID=UPI001FCE3443|nr:AraC family transcriptional regulator [Martelella limonii]